MSIRRFILSPTRCPNGCLWWDGRENFIWDFVAGVSLQAFEVVGDGLAQCPTCKTVYDIGGTTPEPGEPVTNLLVNPTFQPPYAPQDGVGELQLAQGWRCGWDGSKTRPEYRRAAADWEYAQQFFGTFSVLDGWLSQRVNVGLENVGKYAKLTVTCALQSIDNQGRKGDYFVSIGIDRQGHEDVGRKTISWLSPVYQDSAPKWTTFTLTAPIENDYVTAYIQASNSWQISGSLFVKSATLEVIDDPCEGVVPPVDPPVPPVAGECQFDDSSILVAIQGARNEIAALGAKLDGLVMHGAVTISVQP